MSALLSPFDYATSLEQYAIPEGEYLGQHQDVDIICTGAIVFNKEGKLLLVQRAKEEKAFPNVWVCCNQKRLFIRRASRSPPALRYFGRIKRHLC